MSCFFMVISGQGRLAFVRGVLPPTGSWIRDEVTSPTFTLVHEYRGGRLPMRPWSSVSSQLASIVDEIGLDEAPARRGVVAIRCGLND
jgi:tRNA threonylcarbamoyladenosine biosynthesis protein TsaE